MSQSIVVDSTEVERWVGHIAATYQYSSIRGTGLLDADSEKRAVLGPYADAAVGYATVIAELTHATPAATTVLAPKPMETELLGTSTASLSTILCPTDTVRRIEVVEGLLQRAMAEAARLGHRLVILRVDADDLQTLAAAQTIGFQVQEATLTFLADAAAAIQPVELAPDLTIRVYEGDVRGVLDAEEEDLLAATTSAWDQNHLWADPKLSNEAVQRFYAKWIRNIASGDWSDCLFVARRDGRVVGIMSELTDRHLLATTGVTLRVGEWIVVPEPGSGAGRALLATAGRHRYPGGRHHLWETQLRNLATIRCIERTEVARPIRAGYTLHGWTDV